MARPTSPHLQVYRLPLSALTSIAHRISGVALTAGAFFLTLWLYALAFDAGLYQSLASFLKTPVGIAMISGWIVALYYHLCAGIRHLLWDVGIGFEKPAFRFSNWVVIGAALVLSVCTIMKICPFLKG